MTSFRTSFGKLALGAAVLSAAAAGGFALSETNRMRPAAVPVAAPVQSQSPVSVFVIDFTQQDGSDLIVSMIRSFLEAHRGIAVVLDARTATTVVHVETDKVPLQAVVQAVHQQFRASTDRGEAGPLSLPMIIDALHDIAVGTQHLSSETDVFLINAVYHDEPGHRFAEGYPNDGYLTRDDTDFHWLRRLPRENPLKNVRMHVLARGDTQLAPQYQRFFSHLSEHLFGAKLATFALVGSGSEFSIGSSPPLAITPLERVERSAVVRPERPPLCQSDDNIRVDRVNSASVRLSVTNPARRNATISVTLEGADGASREHALEADANGHAELRLTLPPGRNRLFVNRCEDGGRIEVALDEQPVVTDAIDVAPTADGGHVITGSNPQRREGDRAVITDPASGRRWEVTVGPNGQWSLPLPAAPDSRQLMVGQPGDLPDQMVKVPETLPPVADSIRAVHQANGSQTITGTIPPAPEARQFSVIQPGSLPDQMIKVPETPPPVADSIRTVRQSDGSQTITGTNPQRRPGERVVITDPASGRRWETTVGPDGRWHHTVPAAPEDCQLAVAQPGSLPDQTIDLAGAPPPPIADAIQAVRRDDGSHVITGTNPQRRPGDRVVVTDPVSGEQWEARVSGDNQWRLIMPSAPRDRRLAVAQSGGLSDQTVSLPGTPPPIADTIDAVRQGDGSYVITGTNPQRRPGERVVITEPASGRRWEATVGSDGRWRHAAPSAPGDRRFAVVQPGALPDRMVDLAAAPPPPVVCNDRLAPLPSSDGIARLSLSSGCRFGQPVTITYDGATFQRWFDSSGKAEVSFPLACGTNRVSVTDASGAVVGTAPLTLDCSDLIRITVRWRADRNVNLQVLEPPRSSDGRRLWIHAPQPTGDGGAAVGRLIHTCNGDADCPGSKMEVYQARILSPLPAASIISAYAAVCDAQDAAVAGVDFTTEVRGRVIAASQHTVSSHQCAPRPEDDHRLRDRLGDVRVPAR